jgi:hypothetical protein
MTYKALLENISSQILGRTVVEAMLASDGRITFKRFRKQSRRLAKLNKEFGLRTKNFVTIHRLSTAHITPVEAPLALISQIQRSGGSLLSQLFDGHPEIHAHPHELKIGYPTKYEWPSLYLNEGPKRWLEVLFESSVISHFRNGYKKQRTMDETFLFIFLPSLQKEIFFNQLNRIGRKTHRDILNAYMTSYFNAWLNNQNNFGPKKYITAFTPRLAMRQENMELFFKTYPDGRLISIIRDPKNWYPSATKHKPLVYSDIRESLKLWTQSTEATFRNKERYGDRVCVFTFDDLICKTESVMRHLCEFLKIEFDDSLLIPSFNKLPIRPNTSFKDTRHGIIESTLNRYKSLKSQEIELIHATTSDIYRKALRICTDFS